MDAVDYPSGRDVAMRMAELARRIAAPTSLRQIFDEVTTAAVDSIPGADLAGVLLIHKGGTFESLAETDSLVARLDSLQQEFDEGPCARAAVRDTVVRSDDLRRESRWPRYAPAAVQLGVLGSLSFKLYTADRTAGALDVFSYRADAWDDEAETVGAVLAAHAATAILAERRGKHLQTALSTRDRIGQAKGIIMERHGVDDIRAFAMLQQLSKETQTKLGVVADRVIETRNRAD